MLKDGHSTHASPPERHTFTNITQNQNTWPVNFQSITNPPKFIAVSIIVIGIFLLLTIFLFSLTALARIGMHIISGNSQEYLEASKLLLPIAAALIGLPLIIWRILILNRQTIISEVKSEIDRETQYTSIFSRSIDQLGQTKELKIRQIENNETFDKYLYVPNIEIRLGGIHSLSRLGSESPKDAPKIVDMLVSYLQENSWQTREGAPVREPTVFGYISKDNGLFEYHKQGSIYHKFNFFSSWVAFISERGETLIAEAQDYPTSRVDVLKAHDAICQICNRPTLKYLQIRKSIFVRGFISIYHSMLTEYIDCVFIECHIHIIDATDLNFYSCEFIKCRIELIRSKVKFARSVMLHTDIYPARDIDLSVVACRGYKFDISSSSGKILQIIDSTFVHGVLFNLKNEIIDIKRTELISFRIENTEFSSNSVFSDVDLLGSKFYSCDLSEIKEFGSNKWLAARATSSTNHAGAERPVTWRPYREKAHFDDEDVIGKWDYKHLPR